MHLIACMQYTVYIEYSVYSRCILKMHMHKHPSQFASETSDQMAHRDVTGLFAGSQDDAELGHPGVVERGGM